MTIQAPRESRQTLLPYRNGILLILLSGLFFTLMSLGVRMLRGSFHAHSLVFWRSLFQTAVFLPWAGRFFSDGTPLGLKLRIHFLRGTFGIASMFFLYVALGHLPLGLANLLAMTAVFWATLLAWFFLGERGTRAQGIASIVCLLGIGLALTGGGDLKSQWRTDVVGVVAALACGLFMGGALTALRQMRRAMGSQEIVFFFGLCGVFYMLPWVVMKPEVPKELAEWASLALIAGSATLGQVLMTAGFKHTSTMVGTVCKLVEPFFNVGLGFIVLGESPPMTFFMGGVLVVLGILMLLKGKPHAEVYNPNTVGV